MKSSVIKDGVSTAPQRSLLNALGLTEEEIKKPFIGIVSSKNDIVPGHMNIDKIVDAVKQGVALAGGVPIVFLQSLFVTVLLWDMGNEVFSRNP